MNYVHLAIDISTYNFQEGNETNVNNILSVHTKVNYVHLTIDKRGDV